MKVVLTMVIIAMSGAMVTFGGSIGNYPMVALGALLLGLLGVIFVVQIIANQRN